MKKKADKLETKWERAKEKVEWTVEAGDGDLSGGG